MLIARIRSKFYYLYLVIFIINNLLQFPSSAIEINDLNKGNQYTDNLIFNENRIIIWMIFGVALCIILALLFINKRNLKRLKKVQQQITSNDSQINLYLNAGNVGLIKYDIINRIYYRDHNFYTYLGYSSEDIKAFDKNKFQILYENDIELIEQYHQQLLTDKDRKEYRIQVRVYRKDGLLATVLLLGEITEYTEDDLPQEMRGVIVEISNVDTTYEKNQKLEEFLKLTLSEYGVSTWEWSKKTGKIEYNFLSPENKLSNPIKKIFKIKDDKIKTTLEEYEKHVHSNDIESLRTFINNYKSARREDEIKTIYNQHRLIIDGITYTVYVRCRIVQFGEDGFASKILGIVHDITERITEDESRAQSTKLEAIGSLAGGVAHDFNNQLNGILGFVDLLQRTEELKEMEYVQKCLQTIKECGEKCEELTSQLLDFAQKGREKQEVFNLDQVINNIVKMLEHTVDRGINITTSYKIQNHRFEGDKNQIENAIINILLNSCDAMKDGGSVTIETSDNIDNISDTKVVFNKYKNQDIIIVKISDDGEGIDPAILNKIFEPFFTTKEIGIGTGMGLAVVFGIIKDHAGEIYVESKVGVGTTVYLCLPVNINNTQKTISNNEINDLDYNKKLFGKILVVDDEAPVRMLLSKYITSFGCEVVVAENGVEAIEKYKLMKNEISLVISDISMPLMNGPKTLLQLKKLDKEVKVILITGYTEYDDKVVFMLEHGALALIKKPLNRDKLYKGIRKALGQ